MIQMFARFGHETETETGQQQQNYDYPKQWPVGGCTTWTQSSVYECCPTNGHYLVIESAQIAILFRTELFQ